MLTRKPSAAAPAAYPTGKEARAPRRPGLPPPWPQPAPGPALVARERAANGTSNKVCAAAGRLQGSWGGRRALASAGLIVARGPPRLPRAGRQGPSGASPTRGSARRWRRPGWRCSPCPRLQLPATCAAGLAPAGLP